MPRYYFNFRCDKFEATDLAGEYCRTADDARFEAMRAARRIVRQRLLEQDFTHMGWIEVEDEAHRPVLKVPLRAVAF
ncbi:MAG TPA: hypothetical protein VGD66_07520 [Allosphingosinicella sp.]|jgi:hypothetical protein